MSDRGRRNRFVSHITDRSCPSRPQDRLRNLACRPARSGTRDRATTASPEPDGRLKIGLLVDGDALPRWVEQIVRRINGGDYARIDLIVVNRAPGELAQVRDRTRGDAGSPKAFLRKLWRNGPRLVYIGFRYLDDLLGRRGGGARRGGSPRYDSEVSASALLPHARVIHVTPIKTAFSDTFEPEDIERIRAEGVDILFRLGFRILRGEVLDVARYGIWSYHHGDNRRMRGGPAGFWELTDGAPVVGVILQILNEDLDGGRVLARSWHLPDALKLGRQSQNVFMQAMSHFPRQVERLHRLGPQRYFAEVERDNRDPDFYSRPLFVAPGNAMALRRIGRLYARYAASKCAQLFFVRQWILLLCHTREGQLSQSMWRFDQLRPPSDRIWADPFAIERDGQRFVFIEEMIRGGHGHISVMRVTPDGRCSAPVPVLEKPYHLSYPFLFEHDGELYMVPESGENRTIDAYRCTGFPLRWEHAATLMSDVFAVDATLHRHDDRWWMFVTLRESDETDCLDELHIFHADHPLSGDWRAHALNPISTDVRDARPAGAILTLNGERYRPAQNGGVRYGYGIGIHRIETLTADDYRETLVSSITPDWDRSINATHTLNRAGGLTVGDASRRRFRFVRDRGMSRIRRTGETTRSEPIPLLESEPRARVSARPRRAPARVTHADEPSGGDRRAAPLDVE